MIYNVSDSLSTKGYVLIMFGRITTFDHEM